MRERVRSAVSRVIKLARSVVRALVPIRVLHSPFRGRIGHLAVEHDVFIKDQVLRGTGWRRGVILVSNETVANEVLLDCWRRYVSVIRSPFWANFLARLDRLLNLQVDVSRYTVAINETAPYIAVLREWGDRPGLLALTEAQQQEGRARLAELGLSPDAEFVCIHCREGGYSPGDEWAHSFRSSKVENYLLAVSALAKRGYWCIRMGDPSMSDVEPVARFIDYAHHDLRSDFMDVYLSASCKFFLGSASGLSWVADVFGRSCGVANQAPLSSVLAYGRNDVAIPKLIWSESEGRLLTFREILGSNVGNFRFSALYEEHHIRTVENTLEDIRDLALEMLECSEGRVVYTPEDEALQRRIKDLMRPGHYGYGGINRIGRDFLRKYVHLLGDNTG